MLRTVQRAVRAGGGTTQEPFSHSTTPRPSSSTNYKPTTSNTLSLSLSSTNTSTSSSTLLTLPIYATSTWASSCSSPTCSASDEFDEWEFIDIISNDHEDERAPLSLGFYYDVPSQDEVRHALSSLHHVLFTVYEGQSCDDSEKDVVEQSTSPTAYLGRVPSVGSEGDWMEPSMQLFNSRMLTSCRSDRVYDAFHLLQTEPSVQRMVLSLSSDKAVWVAVLNNVVVRELRESLDEVDNNVDVSSGSDDGSDDSKAVLDILSWIFINTKAKVMDLIDKVTKMMDELFLPPEIEKKTEKAADSCGKI